MTPIPRRCVASGLLVLGLAWAHSASAQTIKVGSFVKSAGGAPVAQVVPHGLGQTPKALILWTDGKTDESFATNFRYAFGMTDGTTSKSVAIASQDGQAAANASRRLADKALTIVRWGEVLVAEADLQSWDATNFTLNWTTNNAQLLVIHFIAIGGPAVSAKVVNWTMPTVTGNKSINSVGFTPDVVLHAHLGQDFTAAAPSNATDAHFGLGAMDKNGGQWANAVLSVDGAPANTQRGQQTNACLYDFDSALAVQKKASFVSMDASGFTVNFNPAGGLAGQVISLALKGVAAKAGSFLKSTLPVATYVQGGSQNFGGASSAAITLPGASTTGDVIALSFDYANRAAVVSSVVDSKGNTYSKVYGPTDWGSGSDRMYTYYAKNITGGGAPIQITITLSANSGGFWEVYATEFGGVDTVNPLDQSSQTTGNANPLVSSGVTTTSPDEVLYAFCDCDAGGITPNSPFTGRENLNGNFTADRSVASIGTYSVTGSNPSSANWSCDLLSFRRFGATQSVAGVGFSPAAVLLSSVQDVTQANPVPHARFGLGAADRTSGQGSSALADNDTSNPTSVQGIDKTSKAFVRVDNNTSTIDAEAVVSSFDADGFTLDWTTNDAPATQILYLALANLPATALYRSVGTAASDLNTSSRTVQVVGTTATFSGSMPANVGVGDVLQYQVAATYYLAFISGRISDTVYTVQSAAGGTPQAAVAGTAVGVYRAYTSLFRWEVQNENDTLDDSVENFDTSTDLVAANTVMNVACYGDGPDTNAVTVVVGGWTTGPTDYIRIYTPTSPTEVGTSQRHPGKWDATKYRLEAPLEVLRIEDKYVRVEGLQVYLTANVVNVGAIVFHSPTDSGVSYYEVSGNIVRGTPGDQDIRIGINPWQAGSGILKIWNNLVYDFRGNNNYTGGILLDDADYTSYVYNNTVVDCGQGIHALKGTVVAKNNLVYATVDNYLTETGVFAASSTNNLSGTPQTDAPGLNPRQNATVTFVNYAGDDFHLSSADAGARNQGADLSADTNLAFAVDIDGRARLAPWDIGADETGTDLTQIRYRWRNDDGTETTATWAQNENTPIVVPRMTLRRLRFEVSNEGVLPSGSVEYQLQGAQSASCATATYTTVPVDYQAQDWEWEVSDSWNFSDGDATTNVAGGLTDEATTFVAGKMKDAGNYTLGGITLNADAFTEIEFAIRATATAVVGPNYCFRLYDTTNSRVLDTYSSWAQATLAPDTVLTLSNHPSGQVGDQFATTTPVTATTFQFRLTRQLTVTVDTLRVRFTTSGGIANGDVTAGQLWEDTNGNGTFDGAGPDTLLQGGVAPAGGVLTFTSNFSPATSGTNYFVRATVANLAGSDTTTFSLAAADVDEVEAGVLEPGAITSATHTQDYASGGDVYYSVGTSVADLKTGAPTMTISNGTASLSVAQAGYVGVGDEITYNTTFKAYIKAVLGPSTFVVHDRMGAQPSDVGGATVNTIARAFNTIALAESGSVNGTHLGTTSLVAGNNRLTWVCYNDGPFNVAATYHDPGLHHRRHPLHHADRGRRVANRPRREPPARWHGRQRGRGRAARRRSTPPSTSRRRTPASSGWRSTATTCWGPRRSSRRAVAITRCSSTSCCTTSPPPTRRPRPTGSGSCSSPRSASRRSGTRSSTTSTRTRSTPTRRARPSRTARSSARARSPTAARESRSAEAVVPLPSTSSPW